MIQEPELEEAQRGQSREQEKPLQIVFLPLISLRSRETLSGKLRVMWHKTPLSGAAFGEKELI